ncbi:MAG: hypothetical protein QW814_02455 [Methanothrix sp.]
MKNNKKAKKRIPQNQRTFDDFVLLRNDEISNIIERMQKSINDLSENASITEINSFSRSLENDLKKLKINVAEVKKENFEMLDMLRKQLEKNHGDAIIESAINSLERSYARKLVELANKQIERYG